MENADHLGGDTIAPVEAEAVEVDTTLQEPGEAVVCDTKAAAEVELGYFPAAFAQSDQPSISDAFTAIKLQAIQLLATLCEVSEALVGDSVAFVEV